MVVFGGKIAMIFGLGAVLVAGRNFWEMMGLRVMGAAERMRIISHQLTYTSLSNTLH